MVKKTFKTVWYRPEESWWGDKKIRAYHDIGMLTVGENSIEFKGMKETVRITNIRKVSYGKQGRDFVNNWVKIEYADNKTAFFIDGGCLGWKGIFGGTAKILKAVRHLEPYSYQAGGDKQMDKTWKPIAAGILQIIAGGLNLIGVLLTGIIILLGKPGLSSISMWPNILLVPIILIVSIWGILAIIGGIYALHRKRWGLALVGSIVSFLNPWTWELGVPAIILITISKNEFE
jgi:hypothetical protein